MRYEIIMLLVRLVREGYITSFHAKKPFYMLEYNPHTERIVQCRGYGNNGGRDSDPQIARFCEQWLSFIKERKQIRVKIAV